MEGWRLSGLLQTQVANPGFNSTHLQAGDRNAAWMTHSRPPHMEHPLSKGAKETWSKGPRNKSADRTPWSLAPSETSLEPYQQSTLRKFRNHIFRVACSAFVLQAAQMYLCVPVGQETRQNPKQVVDPGAMLPGRTARSSSREVRIRVPFFCSLFQQGNPPPKKGGT